MVKWEFFEKRRNVDLSVWIKELNIETYEQLVDILNSKGVEAPPKAYFQAAYAVAVPKVEKPPAKPVEVAEKVEAVEEPKKAVRKSTRRKRQK